MTSLLFATALGLSAVAAYYSIMGLVAIFAAAATPIFIMGSLLEVSKLVVASWLYRSWKEIPVLMKSYFTVALVILMLLTSMGIFGYLSKAHLDQAIPTGDVAAKLALIDEKIKTEKENINANRKELSQLDSQVDSTLSRTDTASGAERAIAIRRGQQKDRARILNEIGAAQTKVAKLNEERAPIAAEVRKVEAEVGPIKYIAALVYEDSSNEEVLEKAVRIVIMMIVLVFDPLAVLMLVAGNWQLNREKQSPNMVHTSSPDIQVTKSEPTPLPKESKEIIKNFFKPKKAEEEAFVKDHLELDLNVHVKDEIHVELNPVKKEWEPELYSNLEKKLTFDRIKRFLKGK